MASNPLIPTRINIISSIPAQPWHLDQDALLASSAQRIFDQDRPSPNLVSSVHDASSTAPHVQVGSNACNESNMNYVNSKRSRRRAQGAPKVKTGCATCKKRRVKCDETKPDCVRCSSTGRKCDGYFTLPIHHMPVKAVRRSTHSSAFAGFAVITPAVAFQGTHQERRAFELFRTRVAFQLSADFDGWFWNTLLLQATHREAVVRHAVLALSSLCEQYDAKDESSTVSSQHLNKESLLALHQYNCAIAELTSATANRKLAVDVCLMTCMLFASFEVIRGHHGSAMAHIVSGVKILSEVQSNANGVKTCGSLKVSAIPYIDLRSFEVMVNRLNSQASQIAGFPPMRISSAYAPVHALGFCPEIPPRFKSVDEARNSLEYHATQCVQLFRTIGQHPNAEQLMAPRVYIDIFGAWQDALQAFLDNAGDSLSTTGKQAARIMQLNRMFMAINTIVATSEPPLNDMHWDKHLDEFQQMTLLAREIVEQS